MNRRTFLASSAATATGLWLPEPLGAQPAGGTSTLFDLTDGLRGWRLAGGALPRLAANRETGEQYLTTWGAETGGGATCEMHSPRFTLLCKAIRLQVGGCGEMDEHGEPRCYMGLVMDDKVVLKACGQGDATLRTVEWDVTAWKGRSAYLIFADAARNGRTPYLLLGGRVEAVGAYEAWQEGRGEVTADGIPVTGFLKPGLEALDRNITAYMRAHEIPSGSLALSKDGVVVAERAYGFYDRGRSRRLTPSAMFRLASVDKMIIRSAIGRIIALGRLAPLTGEPVTRDLRPFRTLQAAGLLGPPVIVADPRMLDVTVGQMIDHTSGIAIEYPAVAAIRADLGVTRMPTQLDVLRWFAGRKLESDPGRAEKYNNTANMLLWHCVHWLTGDALRLLHTEVFPVGLAAEVALSRTRPQDRQPNEVWYSTRGMAPSIYPDDAGRQLPVTDGGRDLYDHTMIASARALVGYCGRLAMATGKPLLDERGRLAPGIDNGWTIYFGSWDGTSTMIFQRRWSMCHAALLFNHREERPGIKQADAAKTVLDVIEPLKW
ncbi:MAG: serine hydrolase [Armatimonadetes bacterium]|nr:serine hydrolase [Armatimonadota bacterium]